MLDEYIAWDYSSPGISLNIVSGRITIFKSTLTALGYPEFLRFRFSPEDRIFGLEPCDIDDAGAVHLPVNITQEYYEIRCMDLVRFVYRICGWQKRLTYRIAGKLYSPETRLVYFDLRSAYEIHKGRVLNSE